jgi:hypothetical protein
MKIEIAAFFHKEPVLLSHTNLHKTKYNRYEQVLLNTIEKFKIYRVKFENMSYFCINN